MKKNIVFTLLALFSSALLAEDNCSCCDKVKAAGILQASKSEKIEKKTQMGEGKQSVESIKTDFSSLAELKDYLRTHKIGEIDKLMEYQFKVCQSTVLKYDESKRAMIIDCKYLKYEIEDRSHIVGVVNSSQETKQSVEMSPAEFNALLQSLRNGKYQSN